MQYEIVDSMPEMGTRKNPRSRSIYDEAISSAMSGAIVKIPLKTKREANGSRAGIAHLIKRRGLPLRVSSRENAVYLERKDV